MNKWNYGLDDAWVAMSAIAETLQMYMQEYIIEQFGCDGQDVKMLKKEIEGVFGHIEQIRKGLTAEQAAEGEIP